MIAAVERGDVDGGVVPIENMIEGSVSVTLDTLAFDSELLIQREIDLPVSLNLCAPPGVALADIRTVTSFPHAIAQCRGWLGKKLPAAETRASHSTSDAAREVSRSKRRDLAAICNALAAELYGLEVLATDIEDHPENETRFVLVGRGIPAPTGHDKTSIVCFQRQDRPGSLLGILQEFAARDVNLTKLESRPTKQGLGDYCFFIDCEGHVADEVVADALRNLSREARRGEVPRVVSRRRSGRGRRRDAARPSARRGRRRRRGSTACACRSGTATRDRPQAVARRARATGAAWSASACAPGLIDEVLAAFDAETQLRQETEALRAEQNKASKEIGKAAPDERQAKIERAAAMKAELQHNEEALAEAEAQLARARAAGAEPGGGRRARRRRRRRRRRSRRSASENAAPPLDHAAFAEAIGFVDTVRAAEASGSRFAYIMREAALLELALVNYAMRAVVEHGFIPVVTPTLVRERTMEEAGFFPTDRAQVYDVDDGELFLVGTSEVPLSALHRGDTFAPDALPARYAGYSTLLPARGRHLRQGHARHLPRAPVRQGRDVLVLLTRRLARTSTNASSRSKSRSSAASACRTAS